MAKDYKVKTLKNGEKRYVFDVNIGYRADGSRIRKTVTAKSIKTGREKVAQLYLAQTSKVVLSKDNIFKDVYSSYVADCVNKEYSIVTVDRIIYCMKRFEVFSNIKVTKLSTLDIINWRENLKKRVSINSVYTYETRLVAFLNWCVKKKIIEINPFKFIDRTKKERKKLNFLTEEQFKEFIKKIDNDENKLVFTTLFYTGLRKGEFCGLSYNDLDVNNNELHLSHTIKVKKGQGLIISEKFKNQNSKRIVPLPRWLTPQLELFLKGKQYPFMCYYRDITNVLKEYLKNSDLPKIRIHDFRHSYVCMLINKGVDIYTVSQMVGHESIKTTIDIYGHLYPDKRQYITSLFD